MPRYINADVATSLPLANGKYDHEHVNEHFIYGLETYREWLEQLPTVSPDEVRGMGEWIMLENQSKEDTDNGNYWYTCSHCSAGDLHAKVQEVPFCWKCGARMKGA